MRKNNWLAIVLLGYSVIALSACAKREIKNIAATGQGIICFGDSITFGYGARPGEDYPTELAKLLNTPVVNSGIDGDTSSTGLVRLEKDVLALKPRLVIIEFCGNDFLHKVPLETTRQNIREMILRAQEKGIMVALVDISAGMFLAEYRKVFAQIARENGAIFIPQVLNKIITNPSMKSDFLHPNANGYKLIAQRVYRAILPYLKK